MTIFGYILSANNLSFVIVGSFVQAAVAILQGNELSSLMIWINHETAVQFILDFNVFLERWLTSWIINSVAQSRQNLKPKLGFSFFLCSNLSSHFSSFLLQSKDLFSFPSDCLCWAAFLYNREKQRENSLGRTHLSAFFHFLQKHFWLNSICFFSCPKNDFADEN